MSSKFDLAYAYLARHEGGLVDHPDDPGGITNYGISLRFLASQDYSEIEYADVDEDGDVDGVDVRNMDEETAKQTYRLFWWDRYGYERLPPSVATKVMDASVNMGAKHAHRVLQRAANACLGSQAVVDDGLLGPATLGAIGTLSPSELVAAMCSEQAARYRELIARNREARKTNPSLRDLSKFERGWLRRAYSRP